MSLDALPEKFSRGSHIGIKETNHSTKQFFRCQAKYFGSGRNAVSFGKNSGFS